MPTILFVLNPGSTSTKTGLFRDQQCLFEQTIQHQAAQLEQAGGLLGQLPMRLRAIEQAMNQALTQNGLAVSSLAAIGGRGGLLRALPGGTYKVNDDMLADLRMFRYGEHASNLGAIIAGELAGRLGLAAFVVDPPSVDELSELARYAGHPRFHRGSIFHALNQKAMARRAAAEIGRPYAELNLIVAHLGGGITIGAHQGGRVIDVNHALEEGPFTPERAGTLPTLQLVDLCFSGEMGQQEIRRLINGRGGLLAYTGTTDCQVIEQRAASSPTEMTALAAMAYGIAKAIGAMAAVLAGRVDAVILTGGLANSQMITSLIAQRIGYLGPLKIYPGEDELAAIAAGVCRVLDGSEKYREYGRDPL